MPVRLILIIILTALAAVLVGFNLGNTCTLWFFHSFENVPVILVVMISFLAGMIVMIPFVIGHHSAEKKLERSKKKNVKSVSEESTASTEEKK